MNYSVSDDNFTYGILLLQLLYPAAERKYFIATENNH